MKMKKWMFLAVALIGLIATAKADDKRVIQLSELPVAAQQFLTDYYPDTQVSIVWLEREFSGKSYEVRLADGTKVEFDKSGAWTEVDGTRLSPVPEALVPAAIAAEAERHFPGIGIVKIERDRRGYEVELANDIDLKFNRQMQLVDIDD